LEQERFERVELEQKVDDQNSRIKQELESMKRMSEEVSSLEAKLKQAEMDARHNKHEARENAKSLANLEAEMDERISGVQDERDLALLQNNKLTTQLEVATKEIERIRSALQKAEEDVDALSKEQGRLHNQLDVVDQKFKAITHEKSQLDEKCAGLEQQLTTLKAQLSSEQHTTAELRQSLQTAADNLSRSRTELTATNEEYFCNKDELEKLQVELAKAQDEAEEEQRKWAAQHAELLTRVDDLMDEIARLKHQPIRSFLVSMFENVVGWARSMFNCFGRVRTGELGYPTVEESMPSP
jgi:chromosome segregation ATPase